MRRIASHFTRLQARIQPENPAILGSAKSPWMHSQSLVPHNLRSSFQYRHPGPRRVCKGGSGPHFWARIRLIRLIRLIVLIRRVFQNVGFGVCFILLRAWICTGLGWAQPSVQRARGKGRFQGARGQLYMQTPDQPPQRTLC